MSWNVLRGTTDTYIVYIYRIYTNKSKNKTYVTLCIRRWGQVQMGVRKKPWRRRYGSIFFICTTIKNGFNADFQTRRESASPQSSPLKSPPPRKALIRSWRTHCHINYIAVPKHPFHVISPVFYVYLYDELSIQLILIDVRTSDRTSFLLELKHKFILSTQKKKTFTIIYNRIRFIPMGVWRYDDVLKRNNVKITTRLINGSSRSNSKMWQV